jgi:hypothetical protein
VIADNLPIRRLVNNQLSGAQRSLIEMIDFLFRPGNCLYKFSSCLVGLAAGFQLRIELIVDNSANTAPWMASQQIFRH